MSVSIRSLRNQGTSNLDFNPYDALHFAYSVPFCFLNFWIFSLCFLEVTLHFHQNPLYILIFLYEYFVFCSMETSLSIRTLFLYSLLKTAFLLMVIRHLDIKVGKMSYLFLIVVCGHSSFLSKRPPPSILMSSHYICVLPLFVAVISELLPLNFFF